MQDFAAERFEKFPVQFRHFKALSVSQNEDVYISLVFHCGSKVSKLFSEVTPTSIKIDLVSCRFCKNLALLSRKRIWHFDSMVVKKQF